MRKAKYMVAVILVLILFLGGCSGCKAIIEEGEINNSSSYNGKENDDEQDMDRSNVNVDEQDMDNVDDSSDMPDATLYRFQAVIIDAGDSILVAPNEDSNEYRSSDKIFVSITNAIIRNENGEEIDAAKLEAGDQLQIEYNGAIRESYPAQMDASGVQVIKKNILMKGYLAIIDDIYQEDDALNYEITKIAVDTTGWSDITALEKEILLSELGRIYGYEIIEGTFDELAKQGVIDKENLYFPDGILITLSNISYNEKKREIKCSIKKWRSGLGAIGSDKVTASYDGSEWSIKKEDMWIS